MSWEEGMERPVQRSRGSCLCVQTVGVLQQSGQGVGGWYVEDRQVEVGEGSRVCGILQRLH